MLLLAKIAPVLSKKCKLTGWHIAVIELYCGVHSLNSLLIHVHSAG